MLCFYTKGGVDIKEEWPPSLGIRLISYCHAGICLAARGTGITYPATKNNAFLIVFCDDVLELE